MSDLDLSAAVEAAAVVAFEAAYPNREHGEWSDLTNLQRYRGREVVLPLVAAVAPIVATQVESIVREQVAREIEIEMRRHDHAQVGFSAIGDAYAHAARIARGGTS